MGAKAKGSDLKGVWGGRPHAKRATIPIGGGFTKESERISRAAASAPSPPQPPPGRAFSKTAKEPEKYRLELSFGRTRAFLP